MNGITQAVLFLAGAALLGFVFVEAVLAVGGVLMGLLFPLVLGSVLIVPALRSKRQRRILKAGHFNPITDKFDR